MTSAATPIRVLLVDDHAVVRAGLRALLESQSDLTIVGEAADPESAIDGAIKTRPDVVLMDLNLGKGGSGADATAQLMELPEPPQVLVLTTYDTEADIMAAIGAGAAGYLLKDAPADEVFRAIRSIARGETVLAPAVAATLVRRTGPTNHSLTEREIEIVDLLAQGISNREIADRLIVSVATVKAHLSHIYTKLGVDTRAGAVAKAIDLRIIRT